MNTKQLLQQSPDQYYLSFIHNAMPLGKWLIVTGVSYVQHCERRPSHERLHALLVLMEAEITDQDQLSQIPAPAPIVDLKNDGSHGI